MWATKQSLYWGLSAAAIMVPSSLLTLYISGGQSQHTQTLRSDLFAHRNFEQAPFDAHDAGQACQADSKEKFGGTLLRSTVDWHSTRFDKNRGLWLVVLNGDVGDLQQFDQALIYCYINPKSYRISYFKAYDSDSRPLLERVGFDFDDIVSFFD